MVKRKVFENLALKIGDTTVFSNDITLTKKGWFVALLELAITLTVGTGTGAIAEAELIFFKNLRLSSDLDKESHVGPARAFFNYAKYVKEIIPPKDAFAAASATYKVSVPLFYADPLSMAPLQTILDCGRYNALELAITTGTVADLLTTPGTATVTAVATLTAIETQDDLPDEFSPAFYPVFKTLAAVNHTDLIAKIGRLPDQRLRRILYMLATSSTAGVPFSGTPVDLGITGVSIDNGKGFDFRDLSRTQIQNDNQTDFKLRSTGFYMLDYMSSGDLNDSAIMHPGLRSKCDMTWLTDTGTATTVNVLTDSVQELKAG